MIDSPRSQRLAVAGDNAVSLAVELISATDNPGRPALPTVIFLGGFYSSMRGAKAAFLADLCHTQGWAYVRFDYRGHGESDGRPENCTLQDWLDDTLQVIDHTEGPLVLIGSSMGAWLALLAAHQRPGRLCGLITLAAAPDFTHDLMWPALPDALHKALESGKTVELPSEHATTPWRIRQGLFDSGRALSLLDRRIELAFDFPLRLIHGTADADVPWQLSTRLMDMIAADDISVLLLKDADHRLSDGTALQRLAETLLTLMLSGKNVRQQPVLTD